MNGIMVLVSIVVGLAIMFTISSVVGIVVFAGILTILYCFVAAVIRFALTHSTKTH